MSTQMLHQLLLQSLRCVYYLCTYSICYLQQISYSSVYYLLQIAVIALAAIFSRQQLQLYMLSSVASSYSGICYLQQISYSSISRFQQISYSSICYLQQIAVIALAAIFSRQQLQLQLLSSVASSYSSICHIQQIAVIPVSAIFFWAANSVTMLFIAQHFYC